jgi:hypothetical protein
MELGKLYNQYKKIRKNKKMYKQKLIKKIKLNNQ